MTRLPFIAGSTGAVGRTLVAEAANKDLKLVAHVRPHPGVSRGSYDRKFHLHDNAALVRELKGCTTIVQLIGTMRKRFASGDTYEASDIGTTKLLMDGAREAGSIDHVVLLSSVGAGSPMGAYLKAKAQAERLVRDSGIPYTIFRPSVFIGAGHHVNRLVQGVSGLFVRYRPIHVNVLAHAILRSAVKREPLNEILEGASLWDWVDRVT